MSTRLRLIAAAGAALASAAAALAGDPAVTETDAPGDAAAHRTDGCLCAPLAPGQALPDLLSASASAWQSPTASTDPYSGTVTSSSSPHLVRVDLRFAGLVNPPGPLGLSGEPYDPFMFGPSPVYGSLEIDVDRDASTGGEPPDVATLRYLGNAARFGGLPYRLRDRAARSSADLNQPWTAAPQVCLTSADWVLTMCGCFTPTVVSRSDASHSTFQAGDTWLISGRFFQRTAGCRAASLMTGGSAPGTYDPVVRLRFCHNALADETLVSIVYALTPIGAGQLAGAASQAADLSAANQTSIAEGVADLITAANSRPLTGLARQVTIGWRGRSVNEALDPGRWRLYALFGTAYPQPADGLYVWTDVGFDTRTGDVNGDGVVSTDDYEFVQSFIRANDGGPADADGAIDGRVTLAPGGGYFTVLDVDGDGVVGPLDLAALPNPCPADYNGMNGVDLLDIFAFLEDWFAGRARADFNGMNGVDLLDIFAFLEAWFADC